MNENNIYKIGEIPRGHELWIEHSYTHGIVNKEMEFTLCFGHNFKLDGKLKTDLLNPFMIDPDGMVSELGLRSEDDKTRTSFIPNKEGGHIVAVNYDLGVLDLPHPGYEGPRHYVEYAKTIIPIGKNPMENILSSDQELEIRPKDLKDLRSGDQVELKVLYDRTPLPNVTVTAVNSSEPDRPVEKKTDSRGKVMFELEEKGNWMFKLVHRDPDKKVEGKHLEKVMISTLTILNIE